MIYEVYSVMDKAVKAFLPPIFTRTRGEVMRSFAATVNEAGNQMHKYSSDYTLYFLGSFDDNSGIFTSTDPQRVVSANEVLVADEPAPPVDRLRQ